MFFFFFFQAEDGIRDGTVTGVQTCALPISDRTALGVGDQHRAHLLGAHGADRVGDARLGRHRDHAAALGRQHIFQLHPRISPMWLRVSRSATNRCRSGPSASRADTMPSGWPFSTTGTCRNSPSYIKWSACPNGRSGEMVRGLGVMTWDRWVFAGSRPSASTRNSASRAVQMPASRPLFMTSSAPMRWRFISFAAAATLVSAPAETGFCSPMMVRIGLSSMARLLAQALYSP